MHTFIAIIEIAMPIGAIIVSFLVVIEELRS